MGVGVGVSVGVGVGVGSRSRRRGRGWGWGWGRRRGRGGSGRRGGSGPRGGSGRRGKPVLHRERPVRLLAEPDPETWPAHVPERCGVDLVDLPPRSRRAGRPGAGPDAVVERTQLDPNRSADAPVDPRRTEGDGFAVPDPLEQQDRWPVREADLRAVGGPVLDAGVGGEPEPGAVAAREPEGGRGRAVGELRVTVGHQGGLPGPCQDLSCDGGRVLVGGLTDRSRHSQADHHRSGQHESQRECGADDQPVS